MLYDTATTIKSARPALGPQWFKAANPHNKLQKFRMFLFCYITLTHPVSLPQHRSCQSSLIPMLMQIWLISLGEGGYPYSAQQLSLNAEGAKSANKYGEKEWLCEL